MNVDKFLDCSDHGRKETADCASSHAHADATLGGCAGLQGSGVRVRRSKVSLCTIVTTKKMTSIIFGATGLCGLEILKSADKLAAFTKITTVTRRDFDYESSKLAKTVEADTTKYPEIIAATKADTCFTGLATTRALAGSAEAFVAIDYGINYDIAKAAKEAGVKTFVLVSSTGASALLPFLYLKTKGRLENDVTALGFPRTIILRPGLLLGPRDKSKGFFTDVFTGTFKYLYGTRIGNALIQPVYGADVGQAAVHFAEQEFDSSAPVVQIVSAKELVELAASFK